MKRRGFLKAAAATAATGTTGYLTGQQDDESADAVQQTDALLDAYRQEIDAYTAPVEPAYEDTVVVGERHDIDDGLRVVRQIMEDQKPDVVGLEFVYEDDTVLEAYNQGSDEYDTADVVDHINTIMSNRGVERDPDVLYDVLSTGREMGTTFTGLECFKGPEYEDGEFVREAYDSENAYFEDRSRQMVNIAEQLDAEHDSALFFVGFAHADPQMPVPYSLLDATRPTHRDNATVADLREQPFAYVDDADLVDGQPDLRMFSRDPETYTLTGAMSDATPVLATSVTEQRDSLGGALDRLEDTVREHSDVRQTVTDIRDVYDRLERRQPHTATSRHGFDVHLRPV